MTFPSGSVSLKDYLAGMLANAPAEALSFNLESGAVELSAPSDGPGAFAIQANSGKPILGHYYWGNLGIDLSGIKGKARTPILLDHDPGKRIGFADERALDDKKGLMVRGQFLSTPLAAQVRQESKDGFPFEASVRLQPTKLEAIADGAEVDINGFRMKGPGHIFRRSELREVSFVALGADPNTSAAALSLVAGSDELARQNEELQMTTPTIPAAAPAAAPPQPRDENALRAEGVAAERQRIASIRNFAAPEQSALVEELVVGGAEISSAQARLAEDLRTRFRQLRAQLDQGDRPLSAGNRDESLQGRDQEIAGMREGRDKWAAMFSHNAKLQDEFMHVDAYLAMRAAEVAAWNPSRMPRIRLKPGETGLNWDEVQLSVSSPASPLTIAGVRAGYAMSLQQQLGASWARLIASAFPTSSPSETYPWMRAAPNPRKWEGERTARELRTDVVTIVNDDYESTIEFRIPDLRRDKTGQIMARAADLATRVAFFPEALITTLLTTNGNAYDGTAFFATTHSVGSSGTINNALVAGDGLAGGAAPTTAQQSSNLLLLLSKMLAYLDDQGQPLNEAARQFIVMTPANLYAATVAAINAMFTSASATNPLGELARYGYSFVPVLNARLTTTNVFYMFRGDAGIKSLLLQEEAVNPVELGPDSEHAKKTNRAMFGHGWAGGVGYGRFELAISGTTS